jgi:TrmH family RNA methyltransferase
MLSELLRGRVCVVLVRARNPNNIGAIARAMHGFGFTDLRLVNDYSVSFENAKSAVDASAILRNARVFATVAEAIADCGLVVGTTAVGKRKQEHTIYALSDGASLLRAAAATGNVALLFGSEKTGLSNQALSHCQWLMTIPMHQTPGVRHASMNLGQAAAVCLYELVRETRNAPLNEEPPSATAEELERLTELWGSLLEATGYAHRRESAADPDEVRRMIRRLNLSQSDARRWLGILRQIQWKITPSG